MTTRLRATRIAVFDCFISVTVFISNCGFIYLIQLILSPYQGDWVYSPARYKNVCPEPGGGRVMASIMPGMVGLHRRPNKMGGPGQQTARRGLLSRRGDSRYRQRAVEGLSGTGPQSRPFQSYLKPAVVKSIEARVSIAAADRLQWRENRALRIPESAHAGLRAGRSAHSKQS